MYTNIPHISEYPSYIYLNIPLIYIWISLLYISEYPSYMYLNIPLICIWISLLYVSEYPSYIYLNIPLIYIWIPSYMYLNIPLIFSFGCILAIISNDSMNRLHRLWADCTVSQADLGLYCQYSTQRLVFSCLCSNMSTGPCVASCSYGMIICQEPQKAFLSTGCIYPKYWDTLPYLS